MILEILSLSGAALAGGVFAIGLQRVWGGRQDSPLGHSEGEVEASRFAGVYRLLNSLSGLYARGPDRDIDELFDPPEAVEERLYALNDYLLRLGFEDLRESLIEQVIKRGVDHCSMEYLSYSILPEIRARLNDLEAKENTKSFHTDLHPAVARVAIERYQAGQLADAVEAALKEVNTNVKAIVLQELGEELDGAGLMKRAFSEKQPVIRLADLASESGRNVQRGFMEIFAGAMTGVRNPKAHANLEIDEGEAVHLLYLASLLMRKLDQRLDPVKAAEPCAAADA